MPQLKRRIEGLPHAAGILAAAFIAGITPPAVKTVSAWAEETRIVAAESGSPHAGKWSNDLAPYMVEVMDCLSLSHPARRVTMKKSAQVGGTEAGINLFGYIVDHSPAPVLIVLPSLDEAKKYVKIKLQPTIDETPELANKIREQKSRDEDGSTTAFKKFRGGYALITGANSSKGLQMITARVGIYEEISEYPFDVDGRGDPVDLAHKRLTAWSGREKEFWNSTPGIKGMCRVSASYEASDQRQFHVRCPQCGHEQTLRWEQLRPTGGGEWTEANALTAFYACEKNGCVIEHHQKAEMVRQGRWIAAFPDDGRQPGFYINQLYSPFVSWTDTALEWVKAKGDPTKEKVFTQQVLGLEYEAKGDSPDYLKLFARREEFPLGRLPAGALFCTMGVDVQGDRLEWGVWAWGIGKTSWLVDKGVIPGDTADLATWAQLDPIRARTYEGASGRLFDIECSAVDSGYNTQTVYAYVRTRGERVIAVKGMPGHLAPALGTPTKQEVNWQGKRIERGILLWPVGTWTLKAEFYANLRKTIAGPDADGNFALGYVHLPVAIDEAYCQQLTCEYLVTHDRKGYAVQTWEKAKDARNEGLDIRVYAHAAAVHLGLERLTPDDWSRLAAERGAPPDQVQRDLAALWGPSVVPAASPTEPNAVRHTDDAQSIERDSDSGDDWIGDRGRNWFGDA